MHNSCFPLTNIRHLPYDYMDTSALALYFARSGLAKIHLNAYNSQVVSAIVESQFQQLCQAYLRFGAGAGENPAGELSENLQYLALYVYGLLKQ